MKNYLFFDIYHHLKEIIMTHLIKHEKKCNEKTFTKMNISDS